MRPVLLLLSGALGLFAQLSAPNQFGIALGHAHIIVDDPDAQKKIWQSVLGGEPTAAGALGLLRFPGIFIIVAKAKTPPAGGSDGSTLNHLVFSVRDAAGIKAKLSAAGLNILRNEPKRFTAEFPDKILVEFVEDHEVANVSFSSFHLTAQDPEALQSWYVKTFGAKKGRRGSVPTAGLPGGELEFDKAPGPPAPTKGRALDHIGFEVRGLREFTRKLAADGMKFDGEYRVLPQDDNLQIAYIIDPEGTRIELTEGFAGR